MKDTFVCIFSLTQVNRELMDVIEKLQSGSEECENIIEKSIVDDEVHATEGCSDDLSLREENDLSNSQAGGKTEEGRCKRKETESVTPTKEKPNTKRKKTEPKDGLSKFEEYGEEEKISMENELSNSQADGKTEEGGCKRKETEFNMPAEQKPKRTSKRKKSEPKDDLSKVDENAEGEKTSEVKVDDGDKLEAPAVKSRAKKASPVREKTEGGARRGRPPKGEAKTNKKDQEAQNGI